MTTETYCVIEEQQSMDGVSIMSYADIKRTNTGNPILFTGTLEECKQWSSQYTWDNPYHSEVSKAANELIASANREHEEYTEPDAHWPSRKWNKDHTDYIDLSGNGDEVLTSLV